ncbi:MAG: alpha/beta fold hydrolase [Phycisphaerales bacterium]|nr:alpha/beta fold hydrolase [Phycisphaerales bacterium]
MASDTYPAVRRSLENQRGRKQNIVFLHGFMGGCADWDQVTAAIDPAIRVHTLPIPQGCRDISECARLVGEHVAALVVAPLKQEHPQSVNALTLVGYSMGGRILLEALALGVIAPAQLVLVSASPGLDEADEREARAHRDAQLAAALLRNGIETFLRDWYGQSIFASLVEKMGMEEILKRRSGGEAETWADMLIFLSPGRTPSRWTTLGSNASRIWFIVGDLDRPYETAARRARSMGVRVETIADAGHAIALEQPQRLAQTLNRIMREAPV